jgi:thiamine-monophosphate kinase
VGDDAAVLAWPPGGDLVVATDTITDEVDFILAETSPADVGHKALAVNLSDLAAMAAEPVAALLSLVLPRDGFQPHSALELATAIYEGMSQLAAQFGVPIVGGDTNCWQGPLVVAVTALGRTTERGPLTRSGAQVGDEVLVTGSLGGSILGRHLRVEPRVREALALHGRYRLHAAIDVSDGLALDASRLAAASGCGIALQTAAVPVSDDARRLAATSGRSPLEHALGDGEDFELLFTAPPDEAARLLAEQPLAIPVTRIGRCVAQPGLWQTGDRGALLPLPPTGYLH